MNSNLEKTEFFSQKFYSWGFVSFGELRRFLFIIFNFIWDWILSLVFFPSFCNMTGNQMAMRMEMRQQAKHTSPHGMWSSRKQFQTLSTWKTPRLTAPRKPAWRLHVSKHFLFGWKILLLWYFIISWMVLIITLFGSFLQREITFYCSGYIAMSCVVSIIFAFRLLPAEHEMRLFLNIWCLYQWCWRHNPGIKRLAVENVLLFVSESSKAMKLM